MIFSATVRRTGSRLLGHEDDAHAPFANLLQEFVGTDLGAGTFRNRRPALSHLRRYGRYIKRAALLGVGLEQTLDFLTQADIVAADGCQIIVPLGGRMPLDRFGKDRLNSVKIGVHGIPLVNELQ